MLCFHQVMTLYEFNRLNEREKCDIISTHAFQVAERKHGLYQFFLFQLFEFYIESKFHIRESDIRGTRCFTSREIPESYLLQIDISNIFVL